MADTDFVYGLADLPADKVHADGFANPVTNATKRWSANDGSRVFAALRGIRDALDSGPLNVLSFATVATPIDPTGVADSTAGIQAAIAACAGRTLYFPRGKYKVTSTLFITDRSTHIVGDFANRSTENGTEISYTGVGPCIQIHTDSGNPWHDNEYNGKQDHVFEDICIRHGAPDTALIAAGDAVLRVKLGAYGIWDWRGGGISMRRVMLEHFEANFVGVQSDISTFVEVKSSYSKYGFYLGPRSDQNTIISMESIFCDRAITIDRAGGPRILNGQFVGCGHSTAAAIEIRRGATVGPWGVSIRDCWFETGLGYQGTDKLAFVQIGVVDGYGAGGSVQAPGGAPSTGSVVGCVIDNPQNLSILGGQPSHVRYIASVGKCQQLELLHPTNQNSGALTNFDALVGTEASQAPTNVETTIFIRAPGVLTDAKCYQNLGGGSPAVVIDRDGASGRVLSSNVTLGGSAAAVHTISGTATQTLPANTNAGGLLVQNQTANTGNSTTIRGLHQGTVDTSGGFRQAIAVNATSIATRSAGGSSLENTGLLATASGAQTNRALATLSGDVSLNETDGALLIRRSIREINEVAPAAFTGDQTDVNPGADTTHWMISSTVPININSIAMNTAQRCMKIYNRGTQNITLVHEAGVGTAAMKIVGRGAANTVLTPKTGACLFYSATDSRIVIEGDTL